MAVIHSKTALARKPLPRIAAFAGGSGTPPALSDVPVFGVRGKLVVGKSFSGRGTGGIRLQNGHEPPRPHAGAVVIYFIADTLDGQDGASRSGLDFLHHLLELNHDLTIVSRSRCALPSWSKGEPTPRVRWLTLATRIPGFRDLGSSPRSWLSWSRAMLTHLWRRQRVAVMTRLLSPTLSIHNGFPYPGSFANTVMDMSPKRLIVVHSSPETVAYFVRRRRALTTSWVVAELARAHALIFVSPQIRDGWARVADIARIPQWILPNTCREDAAAAVLGVSRNDLRGSLGIPQESFVAVRVGFVHRGKGQDTLVEVLPEMVRTVPGLLVVFVGDDTSAWATEIKGRINELGLADHVRFTGPRPDPYAFIRSADLLIHPSRAEGQAIVLLEAMLLRTPILASNVGGIPSSITHGETGWLVPPDDPGALLDGFRSLVASSDLCRELVDRAEQAYWNRFSRREYRKRFHAIFQSVLADV